MSWAGLSGSGVTLSDSPYETNRFGRTFARIVVGHDADESVAGELTSLIDGCEAEIIVVRYPAGLARLGAVLAKSGRGVLPADTLVYWEVPAADAEAAGADGLTTSVDDTPSAETSAVLRRVVEASFAGYGNHYTANPDLDPELALAGYLEWAARAYATNPRNVVLLRHRDEVVGAATLTSDGDDLEIELAGLVPAAQGQGWYADLLTAVRAEAVKRGLGRVIISTQAANVRVQRAWARAGFKPFAAVNTCHLIRR
ncbi:GNAT family N-acetyltransferase [Enemella sp. A6]|uniref:GNAT family N-acetyltransferase n=1 Tax=Enemella sp. A6 TaxID=3440152 RepID=UPI003EBAC667